LTTFTSTCLAGGEWGGRRARGGGERMGSRTQMGPMRPGLGSTRNGGRVYGLSSVVMLGRRKR
jgi:hypothetical protein